MTNEEPIAMPAELDMKSGDAPSSAIAADISDQSKAPRIPAEMLEALGVSKAHAEEIRVKLGLFHRFIPDVMVELAQEGMTMMCVTHEMGFARKVAHRVIFMDHGVIVEDDKKEDFFANPKSDRAKDFLAKILH